MKALKRAAIVLLVTGMLFLLYGCSANVNISTVMQIDSGFSGSRTMTCAFSQNDFKTDSAQAAEVDRIITKYCPPELSYTKKFNGNDTNYTFTLQFTSLDDYTKKVASILGRQPSVVYSTPDTILTTGYRFSEDFSSADLLGFLVKSIEKEGKQDQISLSLSCAQTTLSYSGKNISTGARIESDSIKSYSVDSIKINTVKHTDATFDRTITIKLPKNTTDALGTDLISYMNARTDTSADTQGWQDVSGGREYSVTYKNKTAQQLQKLTNLLLNSSAGGKITYGADAGGSTPFRRQSAFDETLDVSAYSSGGNSPVQIEYAYSVDDNSILKQGEKYNEGKYETAGSMNSGAFSVSEKSAALTLKMCDYTDYMLQNAAILLTCKGDGKFRRTMNFVFKSNEEQAVQYCKDYLTSKMPSAQIDVQQAGSTITCSLVTEGTAAQISDALQALFGQDNRLSYANTSRSLSTQNTTQFLDQIKLSGAFSGPNAAVPISYGIDTQNKEKLDSLTYTNKGTKVNADMQADKDGRISLMLPAPDSNIEFTATSPNALGIFIYTAIGLCVIALGILIFILMKRSADKDKRLFSAETALAVIPADKKKKPQDVPEDIEDILRKI